MTYEDFQGEFDDLIEDYLETGAEIDELLTATLCVLSWFLVEELGEERAQKLFARVGNEVVNSLWQVAKEVEPSH